MITKAKTTEILFLAIPFSLCWSLRLNTFVVLAYVAAVLVFYGRPANFTRLLKQRWLYAFVALYLLHAVSIFWTTDLAHGWFILEKKAALLALPIVIALHAPFAERLLPKAMMSLITGCTLAIVTCLTFAGIKYAQTGNTEVFFYHDFGAPLDHFNALYFSFYALTSMIFLIDLQRDNNNFYSKYKWISALTAMVLLLGLLLMSSRLFLLLTIVILFIGFRQMGQLRLPSVFQWSAGAAAIVLIAGIVLSGYPQQRFRQLMDSDFSVLKQEEFKYDTPFNGLTLRLLFIKFTWEVLDENNAWLTGVGIGDAQRELDQTYIEHNLYHGNPNLGDQGYLGYNTHNQFMEYWLQVGILGVVLFLLILWQAGASGIQYQQTALIFLVITIIGFALIEGVLERQRGLVLITYFLSTYYTRIQP